MVCVFNRNPLLLFSSCFTFAAATAVDAYRCVVVIMNTKIERTDKRVRTHTRTHMQTARHFSFAEKTYFTWNQRNAVIDIFKLTFLSSFHTFFLCLALDRSLCFFLLLFYSVFIAFSCRTTDILSMDRYQIIKPLWITFSFGVEYKMMHFNGYAYAGGFCLTIQHFKSI